MSEITLAVREEVMRKLADKALVIDGRGTLSVDGTIVDGLDGTRGLEAFFEGVGEDVKELGWAGTEGLYRGLSRETGRLGKAVQTSLKIARELDAETVSKG